MPKLRDRVKIPAPVKKALKDLLVVGAKVIADRQVTAEEFDQLAAAVGALAKAIQAARKGE